MLHVGLIGTGAWGAVHLAALDSSPHVARVTLCGRNTESVAKLAAASKKVTAKITSIDQVCAEPSIDVVDIVLPHDLHVPVTLRALAAGKHVICEKPAAMSLADFDRVASEARRVGRQWLVVMNQLYNPRFVALQKLVAEGLVGTPFLLVENAYTHHVASYRDPAAWRTRLARAGGGVLIDGGYHMVYKHLELLRPFGAPQWVQGESAQLNVAEGGRVDRGEDFVQYVIGYDGPLRVSASHAWTLPASISRPWEGFLAGSQAVVEMSQGVDGPVALRTTTGLEPLELPKPLAQPRPDTLRHCVVDYLEAIATQRPTRFGSLAAARQTLAVILAVYQSGRTGQRVPLELGH